jgi:hypothetical protein
MILLHQWLSHVSIITMILLLQWTPQSLSSKNHHDPPTNDHQ